MSVKFNPEHLKLNKYICVDTYGNYIYQVETGYNAENGIVSDLMVLVPYEKYTNLIEKSENGGINHGQ